MDLRSNASSLADGLDGAMRWMNSTWNSSPPARATVATEEERAAKEQQRRRESQLRYSLHLRVAEVEGLMYMSQQPSFLSADEWRSRCEHLSLQMMRCHVECSCLPARTGTHVTVEKLELHEAYSGPYAGDLMMQVESAVWCEEWKPLLSRKSIPRCLVQSIIQTESNSNASASAGGDLKRKPVLLFHSGARTQRSKAAAMPALSLLLESKTLANVQGSNTSASATEVTLVELQLAPLDVWIDMALLTRLSGLVLQRNGKQEVPTERAAVQPPVAGRGDQLVHQVRSRRGEQQEEESIRMASGSTLPTRTSAMNMELVLDCAVARLFFLFPASTACNKASSPQGDISNTALFTTCTAEPPSAWHDQALMLEVRAFGRSTTTRARAPLLQLRAEEDALYVDVRTSAAHVHVVGESVISAVDREMEVPHRCFSKENTLVSCRAVTLGGYDQATVEESNVSNVMGLDVKLCLRTCCAAQEDATRKSMPQLAMTTANSFCRPVSSDAAHNKSPRDTSGNGGQEQAWSRAQNFFGPERYMFEQQQQHELRDNAVRSSRVVVDVIACEAQVNTTRFTYNSMVSRL